MTPSPEQHKSALDAAMRTIPEAVIHRIGNGNIPRLMENIVRAYISALPEQTGERWQHVKRGTLYTKVGVAELQMSCDLLVDGSELVVYRGDDGKFWCREVTEFEDGRFVPAPPSGESP